MFDLFHFCGTGRSLENPAETTCNYTWYSWACLGGRCCGHLNELVMMTFEGFSLPW